MSFFGFDATLPDKWSDGSKKPGFGPVPDAFAGLSNRPQNDDDGVDFEDMYDGLGDQLNEEDDAYNADTFGGDSSVPKDVDISAQTARLAGQMQNEQPLSFGQHAAGPSHPISKPKRTGYENYGRPGQISDLSMNASIWGTQPPPPTASFQQQQSKPPTVSGSRKMMSLEEVEAAMRANKSKATAQQQPALMPQNSSPIAAQTLQPAVSPQRPYLSHQSPGYVAPVPEQYNYEQHAADRTPLPVAPHHQVPFQRAQAHPQLPFHSRNVPSGSQQHMPMQPVHQGHRHMHSLDRTQGPPSSSMHGRGPSINGQIITQPEQLLHLSDMERAAYLQEDAKRAKRNYKIHLLSKDNGLMTPQDKNFITRIQLQQLVTATGNLEGNDADAALTEDFYYQVYSQIKAAPKQPSHLQNNTFAQTYLYQTGGRAGNRRLPRSGESQMRRMEQQVQRAVEAAKAKPKNRQLVIEGSLGKISFSNAKTPKPLLNVKLPEKKDERVSSDIKATHSVPVANKLSILRDIEQVYGTLMKMEDHERKMPAAPNEESSADEIQGHMNWRNRIQELNKELWTKLKVETPINQSSTAPHPFIAILSYPKGKKLIPRVFRQIDDRQRLTILTIIVFQLDKLDVVRLAEPQLGETQPAKPIRDEIDLFSQAVMPSLFGCVSDATLSNVIGFVNLMMKSLNVLEIAKTRIGLSLLTMFLSRCELVKQSGHADEADWEEWTGLYNTLFDQLEPYLLNIFTTPVEAGDDMYAWQFLAAIGIGASPEQQQRLVIAVKDRVMDTIQFARSLDSEASKARLDNVNLFLKAFELDVDMLA